MTRAGCSSLFPGSIRAWTLLVGQREGRPSVLACKKTAVPKNSKGSLLGELANPGITTGKTKPFTKTKSSGGSNSVVIDWVYILF